MCRVVFDDFHTREENILKPIIHISTTTLTNTHLLSVDVALAVVCAPRAGGVAETGSGVRQVGQSHHLLSHSVIAAHSHQPLRLAVRYHVHLGQLIGRSSVVGSCRVQALGVRVDLTWVCPLLDDRGHPGIRHLEGSERGKD